AKMYPAVIDRRYRLTQRNSAIVRRYALMPIRRKAVLPESSHRTLRQVTILKTAACQQYARFSDTPCNMHNHLDQGVVEFRRDYSCFHAVFRIRYDFADHGLPIDNQ